ncbi:ankyrin repeat domain-containing protein [Halobacteriovorax sp. RZ-2]|uniref:ankyrin repeat domain-containing protein n=1 Tax=unclassified Halobacteriovorax TaxID=2639665 RepID=UPI00371C1492
MKGLFAFIAFALLLLPLSGNAKSIEENQVLEEHTSAISSVAISPSGKYIATTDRGGRMLIRKDGELFFDNTLEVEITDLSFISEDQFLMSTRNGIVARINLSDFTDKKSYNISDNSLLKSTVYESYFVTVDRLGSIFFVDTNNDESGAITEYSNIGVRSADIFSKGALNVLLGTRDGRVIVRDLTSTDVLVDKKLDGFAIAQVGFSKNGNYIFVTDRSGQVKVYNDDLSNLVFEHNFNTQVHALIIQNSSLTLATGKKIHKINLLNKSQSEYELELGQVTDMALNASGTKIVLGRRDSKVSLITFKEIVTNSRDIPLFNAICTGSIDAVKSLINGSADVHMYDNVGNTALLKAAQCIPQSETNLRLELFKLLVENDVLIERINRKGYNVYEFVNTAEKEFLEARQLELNRALSQYSQEGDISKVRSLLAKGANINYVDIFERTPLMYAAESNNINLVKLLLSDSNLNIGQENGLSQTVDDLIKDEEVEIILNTYTEKMAKGFELMAKGLYENDLNALKEAVEIYNINPLLMDTVFVKLFIEEEENQSFTSYAAMNGFSEVLDYYFAHGGLISNPNNNYFINSARYALDVETLRVYLKYGADLELTKSQCSNTFSLVASNGSLEDLKVLFEEFGFREIVSHCKGSETILNRIIKRGDTSILRWAINDAKFDLNYSLNGVSPISMAISEGLTSYAIALKNSGAKLTKFEAYSSLRLHEGEIVGGKAMVNFLKREFGFNETGDGDELRALLTAIREGNTDMALALVDIGVKLKQPETTKWEQPISLIVKLKNEELLRKYIEKYSLFEQFLTKYKVSAAQVAAAYDSIDWLMDVAPHAGDYEETIKPSLIGKFNLVQIVCLLNDNVKALERFADPGYANPYSKGYGFYREAPNCFERVKRDYESIKKLREMVRPESNETESSVSNLYSSLLTESDFNFSYFKLDDQSFSFLVAKKGWHDLYERLRGGADYFEAVFAGLKKNIKFLDNLLANNYHIEYAEKIDEEFGYRYDYKYSHKVYSGILEHFVNSLKKRNLFIPDVYLLRSVEYFSYRDEASLYLEYAEKFADYVAKRGSDHIKALYVKYLPIPTLIDLFKRNSFERLNIKNISSDRITKDDVYERFKEISDPVVREEFLLMVIKANDSLRFSDFISEAIFNSFLTMKKFSVNNLNLISSYYQGDNKGKVNGYFLSRFIKEGNITALKELIAIGLDLDYDYFAAWETLLMSAAREGNKEVAKFLLDSGADKNKKNRNKDKAWQIAKEHGHKDLAKFIRWY